MNLVIKRLEMLADPGSLTITDPAWPCASVWGKAKVQGEPVWLYAADPNAGPAPPKNTIDHQVAFLKAVADMPLPTAMLIDTPAPVKSSGGKTPIPPGAAHLLAGADGVGNTFYLQAKLKKKVPMAAVVLGPAGAALSFPAGFAHCCLMAGDSAVCIGRPDAVRFMTGQETCFDALGGPEVHFRHSGMADFITEHEDKALALCRDWLGLVACERIRTAPPQGDIARAAKLVEAGPNLPFDMHEIIDALADNGSFIELKAGYGRECIIGLARFHGRRVGLVANNSAWRAGILFPETCRKMSRFIEFCGNFGIPLVFLADCPGFMVGEETERQGMVAEGADLFAALAGADVPKLCMVVRRAFTAGLYAMNGPGFGPTRFLALPTASIALFGEKALTRFAADRGLNDAARQETEAMLAQVRDPAVLVEQGLLEKVVDWHEARREIADFAQHRPDLPSTEDANGMGGPFQA